MHNSSDVPPLDRDHARLLLVMRKLIRSEFGVTISLDHPNAMALLGDFARRSSDTMLHEMAQELDELLASPTAEETAPEEAEPVARYRGAVISDDEQRQTRPHPDSHSRGAVAQPATDKPAPAAKARRVYRGQVVEE